MSKHKLFTGLAIIGLTIVTIAHIGSKYIQFQTSLTQTRGLKLSDSREEVLYRQGTPTHVIGPEEIDIPEYRGFKLVYTVSTTPDDASRIPDGKRITDFLEWSYEALGNPSTLTVEFDTNGLVKSFRVYCEQGRSSCWEPIAGIESGATEEKVLRLGTPHRIKIESATKVIHFEDIGVTAYLIKGKTYMIEIAGPQQPSTKSVTRFLRSLL